MSKKNNFRKTFRTLTELGLEFGVSAIKFGNLLKEHGLRESDGEPTEYAKQNNFFNKVEPKNGETYYLWHSQKTSDYLVRQGVIKNGVSAKEASKSTYARKLAKQYIEAEKLDQGGDKFGYWAFCEMKKDIKKIGLENFNKALLEIGYKGVSITLND